MPAIILTLTNATAKFAVGTTPPANWTTGNTDASCQVTAAELQPTANTVDAPPRSVRVQPRPPVFVVRVRAAGLQT
jgi:hypothetical protein